MRLLTSHEDIVAYLTGFAAINAFDDLEQVELSRLQPLISRLTILHNRFIYFIGSLVAESLAAQ
jgi:hypothetical protein